MAVRRTPIPLRTRLDLEALERADPCDSAHILGSFWPYSRASFESHVAKGFKECAPAREFEPHISALGAFYAGSALRACGERRFDWVARVLGSSETKPDRERPLAVLIDALARITGARDATHLFFRSEPRPPMRLVDRLSGPEALARRTRYVVQDLFVNPAQLGGTALLVDDIANTGASVRVYAQALKSFAGVERVVAVNLAATRFRFGKDGRGVLALDVSELGSHPHLRRALVDSAGVYHLIENCPGIEAPFSCEMRFLAERKSSACQQCALEPKPKRRWWQRPRGILLPTDLHSSS